MPAVPYSAHPVVDETWDADAAVQHLRTWASRDGSGSKDTIDWAKYREGFAWYDASAPEDFGSYKLPHHDVHDGRLVTVRRGVAAALAALHGARGGVAIPEGDRATVQHHLEQHAKAAEARTRAPAQAITCAASVEPLARTWNQIARLGEYKGHAAGEFAFTPEVYRALRVNFSRSENGRVPVDYEHLSETLDARGVAETGAPAVAWVVALEERDDGGLWALFEWVSPVTVQQVRTGAYRYVSPAVVFAAVDPQSGEEIGPRLTSVAVTNRPFLDGMAPLQASDMRASLSPDAVHIPSAIGNHPRENKTMAEEKDDQAQNRLLKRLRGLLKANDDAGEDSLMSSLEKMCSEHADMKKAMSERAMSDARAAVARRPQIPEAARADALAWCLRDPDAFGRMFPEPPAEVSRVAPPNASARALLDSRVAPQQMPPPQDFGFADEEDDEDAVVALADELRKKEPALFSDVGTALVEAERRIREDRATKALHAIRAQQGGR